MTSAGNDADILEAMLADEPQRRQRNLLFVGTERQGRPSPNDTKPRSRRGKGRNNKVSFVKITGPTKVGKVNMKVVVLCRSKRLLALLTTQIFTIMFFPPFFAGGIVPPLHSPPTDCPPPLDEPQDSSRQWHGVEPLHLLYLALYTSLNLAQDFNQHDDTGFHGRLALLSLPY